MYVSTICSHCTFCGGIYARQNFKQNQCRVRFLFGFGWESVEWENEMGGGDIYTYIEISYTNNKQKESGENIASFALIDMECFILDSIMYEASLS